MAAILLNNKHPQGNKANQYPKPADLEVILMKYLADYKPSNFDGFFCVLRHF